MMKRLNILFLILLVGCISMGCQLASEDGTAEKSDDQLIGVYVSYDYVDLFDFQGYMNDNMNFSGGELIMDGTDESYQGRMYLGIQILSP